MHFCPKPELLHRFRALPEAWPVAYGLHAMTDGRPVLPNQKTAYSTVDSEKLPALAAFAADAVKPLGKSPFTLECVRLGCKLAVKQITA
jgi:hypothetical protein